MLRYIGRSHFVPLQKVASCNYTAGNVILMHWHCKSSVKHCIWLTGSFMPRPGTPPSKKRLVNEIKFLEAITKMCYGPKCAMYQNVLWTNEVARLSTFCVIAEVHACPRNMNMT